MMKFYLLTDSLAIFKKDLTSSRRSYVHIVIMLTFTLSTLSLIFFSLSGEKLPPNVQATLFWVIVFFSSMLSLNKLFQTEALSLTLPLLKVYTDAQAVFLGKFFFAFFILTLLLLFLTPLFCIFTDSFPLNLPLFSLIAIGTILGLAVIATVIAYMCTEISVFSGGLLHILIFPLILPLLLPAITLSTDAFTGANVNLSFLFGMYAYDIVIFLSASILFDYLLEV